MLASTRVQTFGSSWKAMVSRYEDGRRNRKRVFGMGIVWMTSGEVAITRQWLIVKSPFFADMRLEFLPPYSPDFNPIEKVFGKLKMMIQRPGHVGHVPTAIRRACQTITSDNIAGWFRYAGWPCATDISWYNGSTASEESSSPRSTDNRIDNADE